MSSNNNERSAGISKHMYEVSFDLLLHPSLCLSVSVPLSVPLCLTLSLPLSPPRSVSLPFSRFISVSPSLSVYLSIHLSVCLSVHPSFFVCLYICPSVRPSVCLHSVYMDIYQVFHYTVFTSFNSGHEQQWDGSAFLLTSWLNMSQRSRKWYSFSTTLMLQFLHTLPSSYMLW